MREHGAGGAFSAIFIDVVELATFVGGLTLPFDWYALIARTPRLSRLDASGAGVGCGATSARPYCARRASDCAIFSPSPRLAGLAPSASPRGSRASLFASSSACSCTAWSRLCASFSFGRSGIEHRTLRCCDFHSVLFCAFHSARVRRCFFGPRRAIPQWIATWA